MLSAAAAADDAAAGPVAGSGGELGVGKQTLIVCAAGCASHRLMQNLRWPIGRSCCSWHVLPPTYSVQPVRPYLLESVYAFARLVHPAGQHSTAHMAASCQQHRRGRHGSQHAGRHLGVAAAEHAWQDQHDPRGPEVL
jgi:hypothetical protein